MALATRVFTYNAMGYRHTWRGSIFISFISPILFLTAMGVGLGTLVNRGHALGVPYRDFIAPGLLAATAMQTASGEMTYPVMAKTLWMKTYESMLATPLRVLDVVAGELLWAGARLLLVSTIFYVVLLVAGAVRSPLGVLAILAATLTGLAFAAPIYAFSATQSRDLLFSVLFRFVITPLFLLGGTFFPLTRLPAALQAVAWLTPLAHGVDLTRGLTLGQLGWADAGIDVAVLLIYFAAGTAAALYALRRRMVK
jgi:lipooligosaccharide transport system permease protein